MSTTPDSASALTPEDTSTKPLPTAPVPLAPAVSTSTAESASPFSGFEDPLASAEEAASASPAASTGTASAPFSRAGSASSQSDPGGVGAMNRDGVWSANRLNPMDPLPVSTAMRSGTVTWGVLLAVLGVLLIAVGIGMPLDLTKISIGVIGGLGVLLLVLALVPRRKDEKA